MDSWVDCWHLVSFLQPIAGLLTIGHPKFSDILSLTKENEKLSGQNMSTGCPQPMDYGLQTTNDPRIYCTVTRNGNITDHSL